MRGITLLMSADKTLLQYYQLHLLNIIISYYFSVILTISPSDMYAAAKCLCVTVVGLTSFPSY